jgi:hypothetical protein
MRERSDSITRRVAGLAPFLKGQQSSNAGAGAEPPGLLRPGPLEIAPRTL